MSSANSKRGPRWGELESEEEGDDASSASSEDKEEDELTESFVEEKDDSMDPQYSSDFFDSICRKFFFSSPIN